VIPLRAAASTVTIYVTSIILATFREPEAPFLQPLHQFVDGLVPTVMRSALPGAMSSQRIIRVRTPLDPRLPCWESAGLELPVRLREFVRGEFPQRARREFSYKRTVSYPRVMRLWERAHRTGLRGLTVALKRVE